MFLTTSRARVGYFDQNGRDIDRWVPISPTAINVRERVKREKQREKAARFTASV
jgi:hypothetical protein